MPKRGQGKKCSKCGKMGHTRSGELLGRRKGGGNGGKAGPTKCDNCGKQGHTASSCWQKQGGKGKGKGGNANSAQSQKTCWVCGKTSHLSKDCKNRVGAVTEGGGIASSAAPLENASADWAHLSEFLDVGKLVESSDSEDPEMNALDEGCVECHLTIDSGAAVSVVPEGRAPEHPLGPIALSSSSGRFLIANGGKLYDRGIQRLNFRMRCTGASKPLVAVTDLAKLGWGALFGPDVGQLECISTGVRHQLQMDRGVRVLRVRLELPQPPGGLRSSASGFESSVESAPMELELRGGDPQPPPAGETGGAAPVRAGEPEPGAGADEAAPVSRLKPPRTPTALEREEHECSGHVPYGNWCRACVVGAGRMDPHCVAGDDQTKDIPVIRIDYGFSIGTQRVTRSSRHRYWCQRACRICGSAVPWFPGRVPMSTPSGGSLLRSSE